MAEEIASMDRLGVYRLVPREPGMNVIRSRWVYRVKHDADNLPVRWKSRLVCKGFQQKHGIDYHDTYAPVVRAQSVKLLLSIAAQHKLSIHQLDFTTAFLNAPLDECIFMEQPEGHVIGDARTHVWKLDKALYGLKQSPRVWNKEVDAALRALGYSPTASDPCIYIKHIDGHFPILLSLYVDDTLAVFEPALLDVWTSDKQQLNAAYPLTDQGECKWILNMSVDRDARGITLSQHTYITRMLEKFGMADCKGAAVPVQQTLHHPPPSAEPLSQHQHALYRSMIGALLYAANTTRMDISYAVGYLSRHLAAPTTHHLNAARHVLRYLSATIDYKMLFPSGQSDLSLCIWSDADWGDNPADRRSTSGVLVQVNGGSVHWLSKKQVTVSLSSAESEYMAMALAFKEAIYLQMWFEEVLGRVIPITIKCDSQAALAMASMEVQRNKHIDIRTHFLRRTMELRPISVEYVKSTDQLADLLTKPLGQAITETLRRSAAGHRRLNSSRARALPLVAEYTRCHLSFQLLVSTPRLPLSLSPSPHSSTSSRCTQQSSRTGVEGTGV